MWKGQEMQGEKMESDLLEHSLKFFVCSVSRSGKFSVQSRSLRDGTTVEYPVPQQL